MADPCTPNTTSVECTHRKLVLVNLLHASFLKSTHIFGSWLAASRVREGKVLAARRLWLQGEEVHKRHLVLNERRLSCIQCDACKIIFPFNTADTALSFIRLKLCTHTHSAIPYKRYRLWSGHMLRALLGKRCAFYDRDRPRVSFAVQEITPPQRTTDPMCI